MNLKKSISIVLYFAFFYSFAQRDVKVVKEDFNDDGFLEELVINSYLGEIDFAILTYEKGTKKCTLDIKPQGKHPSLINTIPLCDDLLKPEYKVITQFVDSIIFDIPASKTLDPTLGWLLDVYSSKKTIENHTYFTSYAKFKPKIKQTYYQDPSPHRLLTKGKLVKKINNYHGKSDTTFKSWIIFDANKLTEARQITKYNLNPEWPEFIDSIGSIRISKTGHTVFLETDTTHQIFFVSDGVLFQNLQKLKWESIQQVGIYKHYFLVLTHPYPGVENKLFLVDSKKGFVLEFRKDVLCDFENYYYNIASFDIIEDDLFLFIRESPEFDDDIKEKYIPFILIEESMKKLGKKKK